MNNCSLFFFFFIFNFQPLWIRVVKLLAKYPIANSTWLHIVLLFLVLKTEDKSQVKNMQYLDKM